MAKVRLAARVDENHAAIVAGLRRIGASVLDIHQLPNCFDILVGYRRRTFLVEIKNPLQPKSARKLTDGERAFMETWQGSEYHVIETLNEVIKIITENPKTPKNFPPYEPRHSDRAGWPAAADTLPCIYGAASPLPG
jgi:hypothetical protein